MAKPAAIFVALCILTIAVSVAVIAMAGFGLSGGGGALIGLSVITALGLAQVFITRARSDDAPREGDMASRLLMQRIGDLESRLADIDLEMREQARLAAEPLSDEIAELSLLVSQLAEQIEAQDQFIDAVRDSLPIASNAKPAPVEAAAPILAPPPVRPQVPVRSAALGASFGTGGLSVSWGPPAAPEPEPEPVEIARPATVEAPAAPEVRIAPEPVAEAPAVEQPVRASARPPRGSENAETLRRALADDRIEIHLQPIVGLPQRRVLFYEATPRLRHPDGRALLPNEFLPAARAAGLVPAIDRYVIERGLHIAERLRARGRDLGLFASISPETLANDTVFSQLAATLESKREHAARLVLAVRQAALNEMGALERETLSGLAERGFRFALDHVSDLALDARALHDLGIRYVKAPAEAVLSEAPPRHLEIHPADLPGLLKRHGIAFIAGRVEKDSTVADLLDLDISHAQGLLFGAPRPVRAEVFQDGAPKPVAGPAARGAISGAVRPETERPAARPAAQAGTGFTRRV